MAGACLLLEKNPAARYKSPKTGFSHATVQAIPAVPVPSFYSSAAKPDDAWHQRGGPWSKVVQVPPTFDGVTWLLDSVPSSRVKPAYLSCPQRSGQKGSILVFFCGV